MLDFVSFCIDLIFSVGTVRFSFMKNHEKGANNRAWSNTSNRALCRGVCAKSTRYFSNSVFVQSYLKIGRKVGWISASTFWPSLFKRILQDGNFGFKLNFNLEHVAISNFEQFNNRRAFDDLAVVMLAMARRSTNQISPGVGPTIIHGGGAPFPQPRLW